MNFVIGLPLTRHNHKYVWVIIVRLTKLAHFLPMKTTYIVEQYAELYIKETIRLHDSPVFIIFDRNIVLGKVLQYFQIDWNKGEFEYRYPFPN